jgi:hypothetical protein
MIVNVILWRIIHIKTKRQISDGHSSLANAQMWLRDVYIAQHGAGLGVQYSDYTFEWYTDTAVK